jgi:toxin FitB
MAYLLDTNIVSEQRRRQADANLVKWLRSVPADSLYLSVIVIGEIRRGVEKLARRGDGQQADRLDGWLVELRRTYQDRITPVTEDIAEEWGRLTVRHEIPFVDGILAATAITHQWTLVTRNVADVARTGVAVVNPFDSGARHSRSHRRVGGS